MTDSIVAVLDIDGTLIDPTYQNALAWYRALRSVGATYPVWRLRRLVGMGGDQVLTVVGVRTWKRHCPPPGTRKDPAPNPAVQQKRPRPYPTGARQPMTADETDPATGTRSTRSEAPAEAASDAPTGNPAQPRPTLPEGVAELHRRAAR